MNSKKKRNNLIILCVIVVICIILVFLLMRGNRGTSHPGVMQPAKQGEPAAQQKMETMRVSRDTGVPPSATAPAETNAARVPTKTSAAYISAKRETSRAVPRADTATSADTAQETEDTSRTDTSQAATLGLCAGDTVAPWVYPDPSGGLHRKAISVTFASTKPCSIEWKQDSAGPWKTYAGDTIRIASSTTLYFRAHDSCGNSMEEREEHYDIKPEETSRFCPKDMEYIKVGAVTFCIDKYEWPNRLGAMPLSFISLYNAVDSCTAAGKRLCATDEWTLACTGPYGWKYPYGATYEPHACVSHDSTARPSGSKPECRGYFEVYDMAGNRAEWTNTRSDRNPQFYNVKGGFWESGPHSSCFEVHYSYYPQNRHNPVGFRCCKDAAPQ
ncbi:MAG TPA: SUMF1/EgtB/PvdO family nonheme iron enzyme [Chitinivibrionales bacterium]|nr:SUMF1/EgtB/PvdO family nonheme iron enzyme [Chitinivibrionales bacterium]